MMTPWDIHRLTGETPPEEQARYSVLTWDVNENALTEQEGIPSIVHGFRGLLAAVRLLREHGYPANRNAHGSDPSVLIERIDEVAREFRQRMEKAREEHPEAFVDPIPFTE